MKMKWRKSPKALVRKFDTLVPDDPRVQRRQMFGYPAAFVAGNLFMSLFEDSLVLRLSDDDRNAFLRMKGVSLRTDARTRDARICGRTAGHGRPANIPQAMDSAVAGLRPLCPAEEQQANQVRPAGQTAGGRRPRGDATLARRQGRQCR